MMMMTMMSAASDENFGGVMTEFRECDICQQHRVAAATLRLPCCFQQVMCVWCVAHAAEVRHCLHCQHCGETMSAPFTPASAAKHKLGVNRSATFDRSSSKSPLFKPSFLENDKVLNELEEDRVQKCQIPQCPYNSTRMACFHCGSWLCEMHELSHTNELSDRLLIDLEAIAKRGTLWQIRSAKVLAKMNRVVEGFEKQFEHVVMTWAAQTKRVFAGEVDRKTDMLMAEAKQLKHDIGTLLAETNARVEEVKGVLTKASDLQNSLLVRGHTLVDVAMYAKDVKRLRNIITDLEHMLIPAPKFLPAVVSKPSAAWIKDERNVTDWVSFFENEERALLEKIGCNKNSAFVNAIIHGNPESVTLLLEHVNDDEKHQLVNLGLITASIHGRTNLAEMFLARGANIHQRDENGSSPVILAAGGGHKSLLQFLVAKGANIKDVNQNGYNALMAASEKGHVETVEMLLDYGIDVNSKTTFGDTSLIYASYWGHVDVVKLLLERGANLSVQNNNGDTALIASSSHGHILVAKLLIENGADVRVVNAKGCNALNAASKNELRILLYSQGARDNRLIHAKSGFMGGGLGLLRKLLATRHQ